MPRILEGLHLARKDGPSLFEAFKNMPKKDSHSSTTGEPAANQTQQDGANYGPGPKSVVLGQKVDVVIETSKASLVVMALILLLVVGIFFVLGVITGRSQAVTSPQETAQGEKFNTDDLEAVTGVERLFGTDKPEIVKPSVPPPIARRIEKPDIEVTNPLPTPTEKRWAVRVRSAVYTQGGEEYFKDRVQSLIEQDFDAYYIRKTIQNKPWMIIYVGRFESSKSAKLREVLKKIKKTRYGTALYDDAFAQELSTEDLKNVFR